MSTPRILAFGGSLRRDSFNQKIAAIAAEGARDAGAEVTLIALRDFPMPIFDQDLEAANGMPAEAKKLKELFLSRRTTPLGTFGKNGSYSLRIARRTWRSARPRSSPCYPRQSWHHRTT